MSIRRLPVYILLDCSESMIGEAITTTQRCVEMLLSQLRSDPNALETAYVSIITYHATAQQVVPLSELSEVTLPELTVRPGTSLGAAIKLLAERINAEVRRSTPDLKGDYRPIVFLLTDGQPTDDWESMRKAIDQLTQPRIANLYAIGIGDDVDYETLHRVTDIVFKVEDVTSESLKKLFIWLSASIQGASVAAGSGIEAGGVDLSKMPSEVERVEPGSEPHYSGPPRQIFLKLYCSEVRRPYLARYRRDEIYNMYAPVAVHELESHFDEGPQVAMPQVNVSELMGGLPCPYCQNPAAGLCACDALICTPAEPKGDILCPKCLNRCSFGGPAGDFSINQSAG